jgi:uncharacterized protein YxjI
MSKKYWNVGKVLKNKDKPGVNIVLGDSYKKLKVVVTISDANGNVVAEVENPRLFVRDVRENPNLTEEQRAKIPNWVLQDLTLITE